MKGSDLAATYSDISAGGQVSACRQGRLELRGKEGGGESVAGEEKEQQKQCVEGAAFRKEQVGRRGGGGQIWRRSMSPPRQFPSAVLCTAKAGQC